MRVHTTQQETLDAYIARTDGDRLMLGAWVREPGFQTLFVRRTRRPFGAATMRDTLDIANIRASRTGKGRFRALVTRLREQHPRLTLYVECVLTTRFMEGLERMGFRRAVSGVDCFYLEGA